VATLLFPPASTTEVRNAPSGEQTALSPWLGIVLVAAIYAIPVLATVRPGLDWDLGWHLRVGQWVVEHGDVPATDPFSMHGGECPWVAYSWLFGVLVQGLYSWLGLTGVVLLRVALALAVVGALHRLVARREPRFLVTTLLAWVAVWAVLPLLSERPWLFTILFTTLTTEVVLDVREGRRSLTFWLLPAVFALWANLHIQFVYGLAVLGIACVATVMDQNLGLQSVQEDHSRRKLLFLTIACSLATLVNPYHLRVYGVVYQYATQAFPLQTVAELAALDFRDGRGWLILGLTLGTAFALGRKRNLSCFDVLLFVFCAVLCFRMRRDLWLVVLAALVFLPRAIPRQPWLASPCVGGRSRPVLVIFLVVALSLFIGRGRGVNEDGLREAERNVFPARACEEIIRRGYSGPLYNGFDWGGYLIWRLPHLPVCIDGRTNLHGEERLRRSFRTWSGMKGWDRDPELSAAGLVVGGASTPLASLLRQDQQFELVYEDGLAVVFVRRE
jgi:hypothetical protein